MEKYIQKLLSSDNLSISEASCAMDIIMDGKAENAQIAQFLLALKQKGETSDEVAGCVQSMRSHSKKIKLHDDFAVDGCGTGGDGSDSFNISTAAALVASSAGVTVAKHGNRSVSSKCGSSDLLEQAGVNLDLENKTVEKIINDIGFGFMFAPKFHPAMKYAAPVRKELGERTVFNILGPMTNPASVKRQLIGVYDTSLMHLMIEVLQKTGSVHVITAHSHDGMDEFSISSPTDYLELKDGRITEYTISPEDVGLKQMYTDALIGGDAKFNHTILQSVLEGEASAYLDAVCFNAGVLIYLAQKSENIKEGVRFAFEAVLAKKAKEKLYQYVEVSKQ